MRWLAWLPPAEARLPGAGAAATLPEERAWWALRFTPRVALLEEAVLLEVSQVERLWGGWSCLRARLRDEAPLGEQGAQGFWAEAPTALQALALVRVRASGQPVPPRSPHGLPVETLTALRPHAAALAALGCRTWGQVRALPRAGLARRFGAGTLAALDRAWEGGAQGWRWLRLPERFEQELELPAPADSTDTLLQAGQQMLRVLQEWLRARQHGALELELAWHHHLRRFEGRPLPTWQSLVLRTSEPMQGVDHLGRLLAERLAQQRLSAPVDRVLLRSLQTVPLQPAHPSLLAHGGVPDPGAGQEAESWQQLLERLGARLGPERLRRPCLEADHRPECMQRWLPALQPAPRPAAPAAGASALWPTWLLRPPRELSMRGDRPCLDGERLRLLAGPQRVEAGWWAGPQQDGGGELAQRDYFVAHGERAGWLWVFRDRPTGAWFLQGVYA